MPAYLFEIAPFLAGRSVTVRDASGSDVASGTLDANAKFTATLPVGDYVASASDGRYTYKAAGVVDQGDPDRLADSALSSTYAGVADPFAPGDKLPPALPGALTLATFQSGHGFTVAAGGTAGDNLNDTADYAVGTQSVKLVTDGIGTAKLLDRYNLGTTYDGTNKMVELTVKVDDTAHLRELHVYVGSANLANAYVVALWNSVSTETRIEPILSGEWCRVVVPWATIQTIGTPARNTVNSLRIRVKDDGVAPVTVRVGRVRMVPEPRTQFPNGVVSLTFDDAYGSQFTVAKAKMDQYGFPGTAYVINDKVDANVAANLTVDQLRTMERVSGWQVGCHATTTAIHNAAGAFTALTEAQLIAEFTAQRKWMHDNGFRNAEHGAYPQGYTSLLVEKVARRFFTTQRSTVGRSREVWPPVNSVRLRVLNVNNTTTVATIQTAVDDAYTNGYWLILVFHDFANPATNGNQYLPADFGTVVDYLNTKGIPVRTVADVIRTR